MTEKLLQYIWQFQYFNRAHLQTTSNEVLQVLFPGQLNTNQGPDFLNARIKVGDTILVGSIELHIKASEWHKHRHQEDKNYSNVILHVVYSDDVNDIDAFPTLELASRISNLLLDKYTALMTTPSFISCASSISGIREITMMSWKERLLAERLTRKAKVIFDFLQATNQHWEECFWWLLAKSFGGKVNGEAFQAIARTIPLNLLAKHKNQIHQLEALIFGQAGLLQANHTEAYPKMLYKEYQFLSKKYNLRCIHQPLHFLRMRPGNFPTIRLAQLAMLIHHSHHLFSKILEAKESKEVWQYLKVTANDYWHYHYRFDEEKSYMPKRLGDDAIDSIVINCIIPALFAYGLYNNLDQYKNKALQWLENTKAEENAITKGFKSLHVDNLSAFDSQALIELKNEYCNNKRCLECTVGVQLLKQTN
ncbi:DUF2851 family protein [Flavisolibacter tropicus]|uniref:DUF2851 domain-containing protein n=1 Tax=Flavisolibacter tropicus TaxID=1492898 RepID=A0A172TRX9_9BACT|nr:DUF2851 family protein [Flavisolibacter tropicus]ANE49523.1 hypothetical protein SY85_02410 [Flavisolibacter tropicus]